MTRVVLSQQSAELLCNQRLEFTDGSALYIKQAIAAGAMPHPDTGRYNISFRSGAPFGNAQGWSFGNNSLLQMAQTMLQIQAIVSGQRQTRMPDLGGFVSREWDFAAGALVSEGERTHLPLALREGIYILRDEAEQMVEVGADPRWGGN
jgi:hypothetical protein